MDKFIFTLRESRGGLISFVLQGSQYKVYRFSLDASDLRPPRLLQK